LGTPPILFDEMAVHILDSLCVLKLYLSSIEI